MTLAYEDAKSKLDNITVADVDDEERVGNSLVEILRLKFGRDFEVNFWSIKTERLRYG